MAEFQDPPTRADFERAVLPHLDAAYNLARWLVRDASLAQDVVQDAAERALKYFAGYRGGDGKAWFLRIVRNSAMNSLGERSRAAAVSLEVCDAGTDRAAGPPMADTNSGANLGANSGPEDILARGEAGDVLNRALAALPVELRECLILRELEECSYRDIATVTGVPIGTVMSRLWRGRRMLSSAIDQGDVL